MGTRKRRIMVLMTFLTLTLAITALPSQDVRAASKATKALKAYNRVLKRDSLKFGGGTETIKKKYMKFATAYIDKDSVPELVIHNVKKNSGSGYIEDGLVFTYKGGKVKRAGEINLHVESKIRYYKKKGILISYDDAGDGEFGHFTEYMRLSGGTLSNTGLYKGYDFVQGQWVSGKMGDPDNDLDQGITYSESEYLAARNKMTGNKTPSKFKWHTNTSKHRKKYLKKKKVGK